MQKNRRVNESHDDEDEKIYTNQWLQVDARSIARQMLPADHSVHTRVSTRVVSEKV